MMSFHTSRKALSWSAAGKVGFFPILMKTDHLASLCTIWLQETENNGPPCRPSSGLCTVGGDPCRECCPFSVPKLLPKKAQEGRKPSNKGCWTGSNQGWLKVTSRESFLCGRNRDFSPSRCWNWIWTSDLRIGEIQMIALAPGVYVKFFQEKIKNSYSYCLSFHVKRSKSVCSCSRFIQGTASATIVFLLLWDCHTKETLSSFSLV